MVEHQGFDGSSHSADIGTHVHIIGETDGTRSASKQEQITKISLDAFDIQVTEDTVSDGPLLLVDCQKIDSPPHSDSSRKIAGDHSIASGVELDEHDRIRVRFSLLLRRLGIFVPDSDAS